VLLYLRGGIGGSVELLLRVQSQLVRAMGGR